MSHDAGASKPKDRAALAGAILLSLLFTVALSEPRFAAVWRTGAFFDSDDAMRAVQLRDFQAGQNWFDLTARRLDPPHGLAMHWSRIVDVALAAIDRLFALLLAPEQAERATRLLFPLALLAALLALAGWLGGLLAGARARILAVFLVLLSGPMFGQFAPGRIDHHAPQIVTLMAAFGFLLRGLDPACAKDFAAVAALMALSMAISLENLPFFAPMACAVLWLFVADGAAARRQMLCFSAGALVAFPLFFVATVAPSAYAQPACDAFTAPHLAAILVASLGLAGLALAAPRLDSLHARAVAAAVVAAASLAVFLAVAPRCVNGPFADLDPLLRDLWLAHVREVMPLGRLFAQAPGEAVAIAAPVALGLATALRRTIATKGLKRRRWMLAAATIAVGLCAGVLHIRVFTSVTPLAMAAFAGGVAAMVAHLDVSPVLRNTLAGVLAFCLSPIGLALALVDGSKAGPKTEAACLTPQALAPLASLPTGRAIGPFMIGAHILAHSSHEVFAAPYHRNNHGNRVAADVFLAAPDKAETLARAAGATLVVWCAGASSALAAAAPDGLAALLERGQTPSWLARRSGPQSPLLVFAVRSVE